MADFRPLLWDPSGPVKRRFTDTDTFILDTDGTNNVLNLQISSTPVFQLNNTGQLVQIPSGSTTAFQKFDGTRAAGASGNINTDSVSGEMLRVDVDNGAGGFNTRWIPAYSSTSMPNPLGNDLDEAYNAFSGAGTVNVDAGNLTWTLSNGHDFVVNDSGGNYINAESNIGTLDFKTTKANGHIGITAEGSTADINLTAGGATGGIALTSTNFTVALSSGAGTSLLSGGASNWTVSSGNFNLNCSNGVMYISSFFLNISSKRSLEFIAAKDNGLYGFNIENQGLTTSYVRTTNGGDLYIYADMTDSSADLILAGGGGITTNSYAGDIKLEVQNTGYDITLVVPSHANSDILFSAHGASGIPLNSVADPSLNTTAQNIVGAINEVNIGGAITWDAIYANDQTLTINGNPLVWTHTPTGTDGLQIVKTTGNLTNDVSLLRSDVTSTGRTSDSSTLRCLTCTITDNASDDTAAEYQGIYISTTNIGNAVKTGIHVGSNFGIPGDAGYGIYSSSIVRTSVAIPSLSNQWNANTISISSAISARTDAEAAVGVYSTITDNVSDSGASEFYAFYATTTDNGPGSKIGVRVGSSFDFGILCASPTSFSSAPSGSSSFVQSTIQAVSGGNTGNQIDLLKINLTGNVGDAGPTYNGIVLNANSISSGSAYGIHINENWHRGFLSDSPLEVNYTSTTAVSSMVAFAAAHITTKTIASGQSTASPIGVNIELEGNSNDTGGFVYGVKMSADDGGGDATFYGVHSDASFDYGLYSQSNAEINITGITSNNASVIIDNTSGGLISSLTTVRGMYVEMNGHASDTAGNIQGITLSYIDGGGSLTSTKAININNAWDYGIYSSTESYLSKLGQTSGITQAVSVASSSGGLTNSLSCIKGIVIDVNGHANDTAGNAYALQINDFNANSGTLTSTRGIRIGNNWDWGLYSTSVCQINVNDNSAYPALYTVSTGSTALTAGQIRQGIQSYSTGHVSDAATAKLISYVVASDAIGSAVRYGVYAYGSIDFAVFAKDNHIEADANYSIIHDDNRGIVNVLTTNSVAVNEGSFYGIKVDHTGNASDNGVARYYNFHSDSDGAGVNIQYGYYAGHITSSGLDTGFYVENVGIRSIYCYNGNATVAAQTGDYTPTASTTALVYTNLVSEGIGSSNWYNNVARYTHHASDTGSPVWFGFASESSGTKIATTTTGFRAQSSLDVGFDSYAVTNNFIRNDDVTTSILPIVNIENKDNDISGGAAPALKVTNVYTGSTGEAVEINHAYAGGSTQDTRRAIVFTNAKTNKRTLTPGIWRPHNTTVTTQDWEYECTGTLQRWIVVTSTEKYIVLPLALPHYCTIKSADIQVYHQNISTVASTLKLFRHGNATGVSSQQATQNGSTGTGAQTITLSGLSILVDNTQFDYYLQYKCGAHSSSGTNYIYSAHITYEITDFAAGCGW